MLLKLEESEHLKKLGLDIEIPEMEDTVSSLFHFKDKVGKLKVFRSSVSNYRRMHSEFENTFTVIREEDKDYILFPKVNSENLPSTVSTSFGTPFPSASLYPLPLSKQTSMEVISTLPIREGSNVIDPILETMNSQESIIEDFCCHYY